MAANMSKMMIDPNLVVVGFCCKSQSLVVELW